MCKKNEFSKLYLYRGNSKIYASKRKFAEISKLVLCLDFQIKQNQKNN